MYGFGFILPNFILFQTRNIHFFSSALLVSDFRMRWIPSSLLAIFVHLHWLWKQLALTSSDESISFSQVNLTWEWTEWLKSGWVIRNPLSYIYFMGKTGGKIGNSLRGDKGYNGFIASVKEEENKGGTVRRDMGYFSRSLGQKEMVEKDRTVTLSCFLYLAVSVFFILNPWSGYGQNYTFVWVFTYVVVYQVVLTSTVYQNCTEAAQSCCTNLVKIWLKANQIPNTKGYKVHSFWYLYLFQWFEWILQNNQGSTVNDHADYSACTQRSVYLSWISRHYIFNLKFITLVSFIMKEGK